MNLDKLPRLIYELERTAARQVTPVTAWHVLEGELEPADVEDVAFSDLPTRHVPFLWGGPGVTNWFFARLSLPKPGPDEVLILHLDVGEGLVFLDGEPYHGTDVHHRDIPLPARDGVLVAVEAYSGPGPEKTLFRTAELRLVDAVAERFLRTLRNLRDVVDFFPEGDETRLQLTQVVRSALAQIDPRRPGSESWYTSLRRAEETLREGLSDLHSAVFGEVLAVGHSHIDVAWLWRIKEVQRKCGRTFSTALRLLDEFPAFRFVQSQPQLYAYTKERYPTLYEQIRRRVRENRWEPVGAMWVEADCNLTSGESLVRQLLYGKRFFEQEFGVNVRNLWLPDVFGYSWALPQLLRKAEVEGFFTAKIGWNKQNPFPHSTFWWQGVDGSQVLSHLSFHPHLYNIQLTPKDVREAWNRFRQKGAS
ncbi:MAG: alpha-mannosidase, partial [Calditrichaeota bacterium]|nr:alpha-mannosidase [Calditrichota bacterium]